VPDDGRLLVQFRDDVRVVAGDMPDRFVGEHLRVLVRLLDGIGVIGP
jgi:hypothetical protein